MLFGFCEDCKAVLQADSSGHFPYCGIVQEQVRNLMEVLEVSVPTEAGFDWSSVTGTAVAAMRQPKTEPVPGPIIRLAQVSYEGVPDPADPDGPRLHWHRHEFETPERAALFAAHMKNAGAHTSPATTVTVKIDPDYVKGDPEEARNPRMVAWKAGTKKGPRGAV